MALDPYFRDVADGKIARSKGPMIVAWIAVFCANLPVPLFLAAGLTQKAGKGGMILAILLMLALGAMAVSASRKGGWAVVIGGWIVAVSQLMPVLHIIAGSMGMSAALGGTKAYSAGLDDEPGGFIATIVTGGILITIALAIGAVLLLVRAAFMRWSESQLRKPAKYELLDF
ncbi:hypothetical protein TA3x_000412 [Tundrisphaera sp. TA3]|uniref:hypothetical protein n=1 Tax=Tundrisphaera sp. TA3 TaxID=3435775 RepID=UPI003EB86DE8